MALKNAVIARVAIQQRLQRLQGGKQLTARDQGVGQPVQGGLQGGLQRQGVLNPKEG